VITHDDFTLLPEGLFVSMEGTVVPCPVCGRNGFLQEERLDGPVWLHTETTTVLGDGMLVEPTDWCALPPLRE
jgi:hypothetical protein